MTNNSQRAVFIVAIFLVAMVIIGVSPAWARVGVVSTWLGRTYAGDGTDANSANLDGPHGFIADASCNLYIADTLNHVIRKIDGTTNVITTFAGSGQLGLVNGSASAATFKQPSEVALGPSGELYVSDSDGPRIRRVKDGVIRNWISGIKNSDGLLISGTTMYVSDTGNNRVVRGSTLNSTLSVVATGITKPGKLALSGNDLYLVYNSGAAFGKIDLTTGVLTPIKTDFLNADGLTLHNGLIYIISGEHGVWNDISTYNPSNGGLTLIKHVLENQWYNHASDIDFCGTSMRLLFSGGSSVYRADELGLNEEKVAGLYRWNDSADGPRATALVGRPTLLVMSPNKLHLYLTANQQIKEVNLRTNQLKYIAGAAPDDYVDGTATIARLSRPSQMVISPKGTTLYIADRNNNRIRVFNIQTKLMTTLTGAGYTNAFNETSNAYAEGAACPSVMAPGTAGCAYFNRPMGLARSADGKTLYVADTNNNRIRTVNVATGRTALLAGTGTAGLKNGATKNARFNAPISLLLSTNGRTLYVVEANNHDIRTIDLKTKQVGTLVGNGKAGFRDGAFSQARLSLPNYLAFGPKNILYLSEGGTLRIRELNLVTRQIRTLAGSGKAGSLNGLPTQASFANPKQLVMLDSKTLLVADNPNDMIRAISLK